MANNGSIEELSSQTERLRKEKVKFLTEITDLKKDKAELAEKFNLTERTLKEAQKKIETLTSKLTSTEEYLNLKINAVNNLVDKIKLLESKPSEAIKNSSKLEKIKRILSLKGFLSEKEFESI